MSSRDGLSESPLDQGRFSSWGARLIKTNASDSVIDVSFVPSAIFLSLRAYHGGCQTHCLIEVVPGDEHDELEATLAFILSFNLTKCTKSSGSDCLCHVQTNLIMIFFNIWIPLFLVVRSQLQFHA